MYGLYLDLTDHSQGQGFNSYTHETRIDNAVTIGDDTPKQGTSQRKASKQPFRDSGIDIGHAPASQSQATPTESSSHLGDATTSEQSPAKPQVTTTARVHGTHARPRPQAPTTSASELVYKQQIAASSSVDQPCHVMRPVWDSNQSVTYSSWQVDSLNEIADALNISSFARVKYATVEANVNASMIHESKIQDSQLNYMVSVKVSNDSERVQEHMEFQPIEGLPPEKFTQVYGDCFISDFLDGGEFQAIISIKVNDKSKLRKVKEAVDFQLSVPPVPELEVGAGESVEKGHSETFRNTETTISVRSNGGGVIKEPGAKWTLNSVVAVANAFPSLVAACPSKTSAILTPYTSLKTFQEWMWKMSKDSSWKAFVDQDDHWQNRLILSYAPCHIYTSALYDDLMKYKYLQRRITDVIKHPTRYRPRHSTTSTALPSVHHITPKSDLTGESPQSLRKPERPTVKTDKANLNRGSTFGLQDPDNPARWELATVDQATDPLPVDVATMKKADLLCRAALTLIVEEAARLVDHPHLAYAEFDDVEHTIRINRPNYPVPELLEQRLPVFSGNDATDEVLSDDYAVIHTMRHANGDDLYFHLVGDVPNPHRSYKTFSSLDASEPQILRNGTNINRVKRLSIHAYKRHWWNWSPFWKASDMSIGAIGFAWSKAAGTKKKGTGKTVAPDGCTKHFGGKQQASEENYRTLDLSPPRQGPEAMSGPSDTDTAAAGIARIDIQYAPGDGRIASLTLYESPPSTHGGLADKSLPVMSWAQWDHDGSDGRMPDNLKTVTQTPPQDGARWVFVGMCGAFDEEGFFRGGGRVLSRVSGVWRRV